jgi:hypothetical protein
MYALTIRENVIVLDVLDRFTASYTNSHFNFYGINYKL